MPVWAIIIIAAFGGGLAGAVLQPVTQYLMDSFRFNARLGKSRERHLRRMVADSLDSGSRLIGTVAMILYRELEGIPLTPEEYRAILDPLVFDPEPMNRPSWEPERIQPADLQKLARDHRAAVIDLLNIMWPSRRPGVVPERLYERIEYIDRVRPEITTRMDELNWPELDQ